MCGQVAPPNLKTPQSQVEMEVKTVLHRIKLYYVSLIYEFFHVDTFYTWSTLNSEQIKARKMEKTLILCTFHFEAFFLEKLRISINIFKNQFDIEFFERSFEYEISENKY